MRKADYGNKRCRIMLSDSRFCDELLAVEDWFKLNGKWVFRGQASITWNLTNTLERKYKSHVLRDNTINPDMPEKERLTEYLSNSDNYVTNYLESFEKQLIKRFKESIGEDCADDTSLVKYMSLMQHYGLPTRLLDFTTSPNIALFFALCNQGETARGTDRVIWAINTCAIDAWVVPYKKQMIENNDYTESEVELKLADKLILNAHAETTLRHRWYPIRMAGNNLRMIAQKGLFMMPLSVGSMEYDLAETMGYAYNPYETHRMSFEEFNSLTAEDKSHFAVVSIEFPVSADNKARSVLKTKKISWERLFPDKSLVEHLIGDIA